MDKRSWPWRKKSLERVHLSPSHYYSSPFKQSDEQVQLSQENLGDSGRSLDEAGLVWNESEERIKTLMEKLSAAFTEISAKEVSVKQHAKVAEEAVAGWEKAEAEAIAVKEKLDSEIQQKLAAEDRVTHLDGALKECMKQLRHTREEREQGIRNALVKHRAEWERAQRGLEEKLEEAEADRLNLSESLLQRDEACFRAEADARHLRDRLESAEKEGASLKEELQIWNEEREMARRSAVVSDKRLAEIAKENMRLEAECQRLRLLVRKKLPGPAALSQMKASGVVVGKREAPSEVKSLQEALGSKSRELEAARAMCAKMASKLSSLEEQLETMSLSKESTETWASTLIAKPAQFKKEKKSSDLMDDFIEMERLASTLSLNLIRPTSNGSTDNLELRLSQREAEQLSLLRSNEAIIVNLQGKLDIILKAQEEGKSLRESPCPHFSQFSRSSHRGNGSSIGSVDDSELHMSMATDSSMISENRHLSGEDSPFSETSKSDSSEREASRVAPVDDQSMVSSKKRVEVGDTLKLEEELRIARVEMSRLVDIEDKLAKANSSNEGLQRSLKEAEEKLEDMKRRLTEVLELKDSVDNELSNLKSSNADLEEELKLRKDGMHRLNEMVQTLEGEVSEERERNEDLRSQLRALQTQLQREAGMNCSHCTAVAEEARLSKEQEISAATEKLLECQRTILALGEQLKGMASSGGSEEVVLHERGEGEEGLLLREEVGLVESERAMPQMPNSPESEPVHRRRRLKPTIRLISNSKKSPRPEVSQSWSCPDSSEKNGSSLSRFFSLAKGSNS